MRKAKEWLLTIFEAVAVGGALALLPCVLAGLAFGCEYGDALAEVVLAALAGTVILTGIAIYEGWYADHLHSALQWLSPPVMPAASPG